MIFQYNALDYIIETTPEGELLFTIGRQTSAAPKIRYNLHDLGGTLTHNRPPQNWLPKASILLTWQNRRVTFRCCLFMAAAI